MEDNIFLDLDTLFPRFTIEDDDTSAFGFRESDDSFLTSSNSDSDSNSDSRSHNHSNSHNHSHSHSHNRSHITQGSRTGSGHTRAMAASQGKAPPAPSALGTSRAPAPPFNTLDTNACALSWQHISYWVHETRVHWRPPAPSWLFSKFGVRPGARAGARARCGLRVHDNGFQVGDQEHDDDDHDEDSSTDGKRLLHQISGRCGPGEVTAVMGPSGSGKSSLLAVLADRVVPRGTVEGFVRLNGAERASDVFHRIASYVAREESLLGSLTTRETLTTAALLSLPSHLPRALLDRRVDLVLDDMGLRNCQHTLVGSLFHDGLSSGQQRRLAIAIELLSNPSILLLDEPTSGLDSTSALSVVQCLVALAQTNRKTIVLTIHQPPSACMPLFAHIQLLAEGHSVFFGRSAQAVPHFSALGYPCSVYSNPAEHMIALVNRDYDGHADVTQLASQYARSSLARALALQITLDWRHASDFPVLKTTVLGVSWSAQFRVLWRRNARIALRNPGMYGIRLVMYIALSLLIGTVYLRGNDAITDRHRAALLFYLQAFFVFMSVAVVPFFLEQRATFARERMTHSLRATSFVAAQFISCLPGIGVLALVTSAIVVALTGLQSFPCLWLNLFLSLVVAESFMGVVSALVPHYILGIAVGSSLYGLFMVVEGFLVPRHALPVYWRWLRYGAFHTYSFEALMHDHFTNEGTASALQVLADYGLQDVHVVTNMLILLAYALGLQLLWAFILGQHQPRHWR